MIQKFGYIVSHYMILSVFMFASWGTGRWTLRRFANPIQVNSLLEHALGTTLGIGFFICALQWLAIAGELRAIWITALISTGVVMGLIQLHTLRIPTLNYLQSSWKSLTLHEQCGFVVIWLFVLSTLLDPLKLPLKSDELIYHLPHARQWAISGRLDVNEWLRYPWFPYNYNLLYSAALIAYDDVLPHMLHAIAGWLTALMVYQVGKRYCNHGVACLGAIIWLSLSLDQMGNAYIDMGVTLFVFAACIAFYFWLEDSQHYAWLAMAAFFMGLAVGSKYQALSFLPVFAVVLFIRERKLGTLFTALVCLFIPCIYWYGRNSIMTGDPFNPFGGKLFGFTDWNLDDYKYQFEDLNSRAGWPQWILWSALLVPLVKKFRDSSSMRAAMVFCAYSFLIWIITSHYRRYLMPIYPLLALLAGCGWQWLFTNGFSSISPLRIANAIMYRRTLSIGWAVVLIVLSISAIVKSVHSWELIASTQAARETILHEKISGYQVLLYLKQNPIGKTYQLGLEDAVYYGPTPIWGDHFGPGRYRDFTSLKPEQLAMKLKRLGFNSIIIHTTRWPQIDSQPDFSRYFFKIYQYDGVKLYRILETTS